MQAKSRVPSGSCRWRSSKASSIQPWGAQVPAGWADPAEEPEVAICREVEEETGWRAGKVVPLIAYNALAGISTMRFDSFHLTDCEYVGPPKDRSESSRIEWIPEAEVVELIAHGQVTDGPSLTALSYFLGPHRLAGRG